MQYLATAVVLIAGLGEAPTKQFPYEAVVEQEDAYVRSGPGKSHYPTGRLHRGERVVVYRHDPGNWCMIAPPPGSFNWIRAEYVRKTGANRGEVTEINVRIPIGSDFDDSQERYHQELSTGDRVEILDEVTVRKDDGRPIRMYKIRPPKGEFRWIEGRLIAPVDSVARRQQDLDPFSNGDRFQRSEPIPQRKYEDPVRDTRAKDQWRDHDDDRGHRGGKSKSDGLQERPLIRTKDGSAVRRSYPDDDQLAEDRRRLQELDDRFREIISGDAAGWDFRELERDYRKLQEEVSVPAMVSQIQLRFGALDHYRELRAEYRDYVRLASETTRREAELLAMQQAAGGPVSAGAFQPPSPYVQAVPPQFTAGAPQFAPGGPQYPAGAPEFAADGADGFQPPIETAQDGPTLGEPVPAPEPDIAPPTVQAQPTYVAPQPPIGAGPAYPQFPVSQQSGIPQPIPGQPPVTIGSPQPIPGATGPPPGAPRGPHQFDGAGIVQRAASTAPGGPQHVLLTPNGRILAYLQAEPGVNLDSYVGRPMGLYGERTHRPDLQAEVLSVRGAVPVRLKQPQ